MLNLTPAIRAIEEQIREIDYEHQKRIEPYKKSLEELRKINEACEVCGGEGKVLRSRACAEDDRPDPILMILEIGIPVWLVMVQVYLERKRRSNI